VKIGLLSLAALSILAVPEARALPSRDLPDIAPLSAPIETSRPEAGSKGARAADESSPPASSDTLVFTPTDQDTIVSAEPAPRVMRFRHREDWLKPPFGDRLITDPEEWRSRERKTNWLGGHFDYNRVDLVRLGIAYQAQSREPMLPRLGARIEYAFGRDRTLYGVQIEQPVLPPGRLALGVSMVRTTDHHELQQVEDLENSLAMLFGKQDYRDYFERDGFGAYVSWRVPDFSTLSVHVRNDRFRSLDLDRRAGSLFHRDRPLRDNPPIEEGEAHTLTLRLERLAHRTRQMRAGFYHWIDLERAGRGLGGDFSYARLLADLRSVFRLSPATTLALRTVVGTNGYGTLPDQKEFALGGVDGLRVLELRGESNGARPDRIHARPVATEERDVRRRAACDRVRRRRQRLDQCVRPMGRRPPADARGRGIRPRHLRGPPARLLRARPPANGIERRGELETAATLLSGRSRPCSPRVGPLR
jgi:hypothetical protein